MADFEAKLDKLAGTLATATKPRTLAKLLFAKLLVLTSRFTRCVAYTHAKKMCS